MPSKNIENTPRSFIYGGAAMLLVFDIFFLIKALFTANFVPILPILAGILTATGLLFIVYAEHQARERDKKDHRRISRVAHQLESPLYSLQENLEQLIIKSEKLPAETRMKLKTMETKTKILLENIRDVFLTLQAQEHTISQDLRTYNICSLIKEVVDDHKKLASAHNVELLHKQHCQEAVVKVDRSLFKIALSHLIENGILYTMSPGIVNVAVVKEGGKARVVVQDRGIGISDYDIKKIFQPFARGNKASKYDSDGIGVGLTLSRLIIKEFKGDIIWHNRKKSMGSQFEISLPLVDKK